MKVESLIVFPLCANIGWSTYNISVIKKNKFKSENIIKLSTSVKHIKEVAKSLKIGINGLEIEAKEEDST